MYTFTDEKSHSDKVLIAKKCVKTRSEYKHLNFQNLIIRNARIEEELQNDNPEERKKVEQEVERYNSWIDRVSNIPGFMKYFLEKGLCVSREEVLERWSAEEVSAIFDEDYFLFQTELEARRAFHYPGHSYPNHMLEEYFYDTSLLEGYEVIIEGNAIILPIGYSGNAYPESIKGKRLIWNWTDNGRDFCCNLWFLLHDLSEQEKCEDDEEPRVTFYFDDFYEQIRYDGYIEPQFVRVFKKLESLGYLTSYTIKPSEETLFWKQYGKMDGSIDVATINMSFRENKLLMEQLKLLICSTDEEVEASPYFLTDESNQQYLSETPGAIGGHNKLRIYGRLDCPSAARYLEKGQYVRHRVFFADEETAIKAGYRPCAKCMPEAYRKWKEGQ